MGKVGDPGRILSIWFGARVVERGGGGRAREGAGWGEKHDI